MEPNQPSSSPTQHKVNPFKDANTYVIPPNLFEIMNTFYQTLFSVWGGVGGNVTIQSDQSIYPGKSNFEDILKSI